MNNRFMALFTWRHPRNVAGTISWNGTLDAEQLCKSSLHSLNSTNCIPLDRVRRALHAGTLFAGIGLGSALAILRLHVHAEVSFF